jgi:hypothetical protein
MLTLPLLDSFTATDCIGNNPNEFSRLPHSELRLLPRSLNVSKIALLNCCVDTQCLLTLLAACKALLIFTYCAAPFPQLARKPQ